MKVAALYDVHAMPWALEAVLAEVDADRIVFGGDLVDGPYDDETVALARSVDAVWIRGNCEDAYEWGRELPLAVELDGVTYCPATPTDNLPLTTAVTPDEVFGEYWSLVEDGEPRFRRTPFDVDLAAERVRASSWAGAEEFAAGNLLVAQSRDEAIAYFEQQRR